MLAEILLISVCGSLLCLDRFFIQAMISRPVIVAPCIGFFFGNLYAGLMIGAIIELIWIDRLPIGTYIPPNDSLAAVTAASVAFVAGSRLGGPSNELIALAVLLAMPFGGLAKQLDIAIIKSNDALSDRALLDAARSDLKAVERKSYIGLAKLFISYALFLLAVQAVLIPAVVALYPKGNETIRTALSFMYYFLPLLGIAVAINMLKLRNAVAVVCAVFLMMAVLLELFHVW